MESKQVHLSIVSPVYRAEKIVSELVEEVISHVSAITSDFEIILVNDCSPDESWCQIMEACQKDFRVKGINLSRNFGQHQAISAGLQYARGEWVIVMDCDLQDRPDEIPNLYRKAQEGYYIVQARRMLRQDSFLKKAGSKLFHKFFSYLSGQTSDSSVANFGIYHRKVIVQYNKMTESGRAFPVLINYLGFRKTAIDVRHSGRYEGKSSYTFRKLVNLALDIALSNSNKPLKLAVHLGFLISIFSFLLAIYNIFAYCYGIISVPGYTTTVFSIWFIGGLTIMILGVLGLYIGKIYDDVKGRPLFVVQDEMNVVLDNKE